jgi:hypothetical protein
MMAMNSKEAGPVPARAGDGEGDRRGAVISDAVPQEAIVHHDGPMGDAIPLPGKDGAGLQLDLAPVEGDELVHDGVACLLLAETIEELANGRIEIAGHIRLPPIAHDRCLQMLREMRQRGPVGPETTRLRSSTTEIETTVVSDNSIRN